MVNWVSLFLNINVRLKGTVNFVRHNKYDLFHNGVCFVIRSTVCCLLMQKNIIIFA